MKNLLRYWVTRVIRFLVDFTTSAFFGFIYGKSEELPPITDHLLLQPAWQLAQKIRKKQLMSVDVVSAYISRIKEVQPFINAVVDERYEDALEEARAADDYIASGVKSEAEIEKEKPFLGVPFSCKEAIAVKGMNYTAGLVSRKGKKANSDSAAVASLREAGAIPVVSTNVPELCMWYDSANNLYGITKNPYDTRRIPGGSSGGEGALIASAGSVFGVGSDLGGSVRIPAFMNGIFGHKFSKGIVSNKGHYPVSPDDMQDYLITGPLCRYASDLIPVAKVMSKRDARLNLDSQVQFENLKIYYMDDDGGNPLLTPVIPEIKEALKRVLMFFEEIYDVRPQRLNIEALGKSFDIWMNKMSVMEAPLFVELMADLKGKINLKWELLKWCFRLSEHTLPALFYAFLEACTPNKGKVSIEKIQSFEQYRKLEAEFRGLLKENCVFLYPTHPEPAPYQHQTVPKFFNVGYTAIFNILGLPVTHAPMGLCRGLPIGIQVIGGIYNDHLTMSVAREIEKAFGGWTSPNPVL